MSYLYLGEAIKADRKKAGLTQRQLCLELFIIELKTDKDLSEKSKEAGIAKIHQSGDRYYTSGIKCSFGGNLRSHYSTRIISNIERGVAGVISTEILDQLAEVLNVVPEKYYDLEPVLAKALYLRPPAFERFIEFEPEVKQAGLSILNYFGDIVDKEFPNESVTSLFLNVPSMLCINNCNISTLTKFNQYTYTPSTLPRRFTV